MRLEYYLWLAGNLNCSSLALPLFVLLSLAFNQLAGWKTNTNERGMSFHYEQCSTCFDSDLDPVNRKESKARKRNRSHFLFSPDSYRWQWKTIACVYFSSFSFFFLFAAEFSLLASESCGHWMLYCCCCCCYSVHLFVYLLLLFGRRVWLYRFEWPLQLKNKHLFEFSSIASQFLSFSFPFLCVGANWWLFISFHSISFQFISFHLISTQLAGWPDHLPGWCMMRNVLH